MSDSVRPHRRQPTRLPCPWDSPGKNTGVGCHFLLQCMKVKSESEVAQSCPTLATPWTAAYQSPPSMGFSRQKYWSGVPLPSPYEQFRQLIKFASPTSPALQEDSLPTELSWTPICFGENTIQLITELHLEDCGEPALVTSLPCCHFREHKLYGSF